MSGEQELSGPDLTQGISFSDLEDGGKLLGHAGGEAVLVVRRGEECFAIGATCTHYGGPLAEGIIVEDTVRCPWHHACFSLRTGEAIRPPALNPVPRYEVEVSGSTVRVTGKAERKPARPAVRKDAPASVVIVGGGAAGDSAAATLRAEGYGGPITIVDPDTDAPYDRPNCSKDYLAGSAPEEWLPLRSPDWDRDHGVERLRGRRVAELRPADRRVELDDGSSRDYGALLLATGATPVRLGPDVDRGGMRCATDDDANFAPGAPRVAAFWREIESLASDAQARAALSERLKLLARPDSTQAVIDVLDATASPQAR